ncbi:hypothetical protein EB231_32470 [Mesorhizobium sp. NZP2298]|nr:hypothetical protein EB231_32470 [Mesorhizobium sp. NZP2298]
MQPLLPKAKSTSEADARDRNPRPESGTSANDAKFGFATRAIHHGYDPAGFPNAGQPRVFLNSTYD